MWKMGGAGVMNDRILLINLNYRIGKPELGKKSERIRHQRVMAQIMQLHFDGIVEDITITWKRVINQNPCGSIARGDYVFPFGGIASRVDETIHQDAVHIGIIVITPDGTDP